MFLCSHRPTAFETLGSTCNSRAKLPVTVAATTEARTPFVCTYPSNTPSNTVNCAGAAVCNCNSSRREHFGTELSKSTYKKHSFTDWLTKINYVALHDVWLPSTLFLIGALLISNIQTDCQIVAINLSWYLRQSFYEVLKIFKINLCLPEQHQLVFCYSRFYHLL